MKRKESRGKQLHSVGSLGRSPAPVHGPGQACGDKQTEGLLLGRLRLWLLSHLRNLQHKQKEKQLERGPRPGTAPPGGGEGKRLVITRHHR